MNLTTLAELYTKHTNQPKQSALTVRVPVGTRNLLEYIATTTNQPLNKVASDILTLGVHELLVAMVDQRNLTVEDKYETVDKILKDTGYYSPTGETHA